MDPFEKAPEFIEWDNRQHRVFNPVSKQQMIHKHEVLLPKELLENKSVLDLGCALGATGHWCLSNGAKKYKGIEGQKTYADKARILLEKYHPGKSTVDAVSIEQCLDETSEPYDIVCALGVIYVFVDYYSILKKICARAKEIVVIDSIYPFGSYFRPGFVGVQFLDSQNINLADENASLRGRGSRLSPLGYEFVMKDFGFESHEGLLYPKPITNTLDSYNSMKVGVPRFLMRFTRVEKKAMNLSEDLLHDRTGERTLWNKQ